MVALLSTTLKRKRKARKQKSYHQPSINPRNLSSKVLKKMQRRKGITRPKSLDILPLFRCPYFKNLYGFQNHYMPGCPFGFCDHTLAVFKKYDIHTVADLNRLTEAQQSSLINLIGKRNQRDMRAIVDHFQKLKNNIPELEEPVLFFPASEAVHAANESLLQEAALNASDESLLQEAVLNASDESLLQEASLNAANESLLQEAVLNAANDCDDWDNRWDDVVDHPDKELREALVMIEEVLLDDSDSVNDNSSRNFKDTIPSTVDHPKKELVELLAELEEVLPDDSDSDDDNSSGYKGITDFDDFGRKYLRVRLRDHIAGYKHITHGWRVKYQVNGCNQLIGSNKYSPVVTIINSEQMTRGNNFVKENYLNPTRIVAKGKKKPPMTEAYVTALNLVSLLHTGGYNFMPMRGARKCTAPDSSIYQCTCHFNCPHWRKIIEVTLKPEFKRKNSVTYLVLEAGSHDVLHYHYPHLCAPCGLPLGL